MGEILASVLNRLLPMAVGLIVEMVPRHNRSAHARDKQNGEVCKNIGSV